MLFDSFNPYQQMYADAKVFMSSASDLEYFLRLCSCTALNVYEYKNKLYLEYRKKFYYAADFLPLLHNNNDNDNNDHNHDGDNSDRQLPRCKAFCLGVQ